MISGVMKLQASPLIRLDRLRHRWGEGLILPAVLTNDGGMLDSLGAKWTLFFIVGQCVVQIFHDCHDQDTEWSEQKAAEKPSANASALTRSYHCSSDATKSPEYQKSHIGLPRCW
jgi:hypothetical protein